MIALIYQILLIFDFSFSNIKISSKPNPKYNKINKFWSSNKFPSF